MSEYNEKRRKKLQDYLDLAEKFGMQLISMKIPKLSTVKVEWKASCGHTLEKSYNHLKYHPECIFCSIHCKKAEKDYFNLANQKQLKYLGPFPESTHSVTNWICHCKKMFSCRYDHIRKGVTCSDCAILKKKGINTDNPNTDFKF